MLAVAVPHIERSTLRDVEQAGVLLLAFHAIMAPDSRIAEVMCNVLVELVVLVVADLSFITRPQRLGFVDLLPGYGVVLFIFGFDLYRQCDVIGIFADDVTHAPGVKEIIFPCAEMQRDLGTAIGFFDFCQGIFALAF